MGHRALGLLAVFLLAVGCGGKVEQGGGSGGTSNGGSSNGGSSNGGGPNGGSGGTAPVSCSGATDCCVKACTLLTNAIQCPNTPNAECNCGPLGSLPTACKNALTDAYRCLLKVGPKAVTCDQNGNLSMRCGFCQPELQALAQACSGTQTQCVN